MLFGSAIGLLLGDRLPAQVRESATTGVGLITLVVGVQMALSTHNILITLAAVVVGGALGTWWRLSEALQAFGDWVERRTRRGKAADQPAGRISQGFVTASLIFCVGPMTIIGSITDGLSGDMQLLAIKSLLDGITSIALAATLGWGVLLSGLTVLVVQGGFSLLALIAGQSLVGLVSGRTVQAGAEALPLGATLLDEMTAAGGVLILGIALLLLEIKPVRVASYLPAIALAPLIVLILFLLGAPIAP